MPTPDDLRARPGDTIPERLDRFEAYAKGTDIVIAGANHRIDRTYDKTVITLADDSPWSHPFKSAASHERAVVAPGTLDAAGFPAPIVPTIDGIDLYGDNAAADYIGIPEIDTTEGPGDDGRSFIALAYSANPEDPLEPDPDSDDPVTIIHTPSMIEERKTRGPDFGLRTIAILYWNPAQDALRRIGQVTLHNQDVHWIPGQGEGTGRFAFAAT